MAAYSQMSWLDPALHSFSDEEATPVSTPQREASPPTSEERNSVVPEALARLTLDDIKRLPEVLFCDPLPYGPGGRHVAHLYMLPKPLPCPWPPMGPFAPVTREDLHVVEFPLSYEDLVGCATEALPPMYAEAASPSSDSDDTAVAAEEFKWLAFEPQTKSFGAEPLSAITKHGEFDDFEQSDEEDTEDDYVAAPTPVSSNSKNGGSKRKRSSKKVATDAAPKRMKRKYSHEEDEFGKFKRCLTCDKCLRTPEEQRHSGKCGGPPHCDLCGQKISRGDKAGLERHYKTEKCKKGRLTWRG